MLTVKGFPINLAIYSVGVFLLLLGGVLLDNLILAFLGGGILVFRTVYLIDILSYRSEYTLYFPGEGEGLYRVNGLLEEGDIVLVDKGGGDDDTFRVVLMEDPTTGVLLRYESPVFDRRATLKKEKA